MTNKHIKNINSSVKVRLPEGSFDFIYSNMPSHCCVSGCKSNYNNQKNHVSVFSFPKDEEMRKKWISAMCRKNWAPAKRTAVCALHFCDTDIIRYETWPLPDGSIKTSLIKRPQLLKTSVPSIFPITSLRSNPDEDGKDRISPEIKKRRSKKLTKLEQDMENYMQWKMMGVQKRMKNNVIPHIFACQEDGKRICPKPVVKRARKSIIQDVLCEASTSKSGLPLDSSTKQEFTSALSNIERNVDKRTKRNNAKKRKAQPALVENTVLVKQESVKSCDFTNGTKRKSARIRKAKPVNKSVLVKQESVKSCDVTNIAITNEDEKKVLATKEKVGNAPRITLNSDIFDLLDLNNLILSTTSIFEGMCKELKLSTIMNKHVDNLNADKEQITLTTSAGLGDQSSQIENINKNPEDATPSLSETTDDLERMLTDVERTLASAEEENQMTLDTRTMSTQTDNRNRYLEMENENLKLENAALKNQILCFQKLIQQHDVPKLLVVCGDDE